MLLKHHPVLSASKIIQPTKRPDSLLSNYRRWLILWYAPPHYRAYFYW